MLLATTREKPRRSARKCDVDVVGCAGDRARAERHHVGFAARRVEPIDVAPEGGGVREPHVRDQHGLRAAQVRVRRHDGLAGPVGLMDERTHEPRNRRAGRAECAASGSSRKSTDTCSLRDRPVCSRRPASPMRATSSRSTNECTSSSDALRMSAGVGADGLANLIEASDDRADVGGVEHAGLAERLGPRLAAGDVVLDEPAIDGQRLAVVEDVLVGLRRESAGPERAHRDVDFGSLRTSNFGLSYVATSRTAWRPTTRQSPLTSLRRTVAGHLLLHVGDERVDGFAHGRVPLPLAHEIGVSHAELGGQTLRGRAASRPAADPDEPWPARRPLVLRRSRATAAPSTLPSTSIGETDAVRAGDRLERLDELDERHRNAIELHRHAALELDLDERRPVRRLVRRLRPRVQILGHVLPRILEQAAWIDRPQRLASVRYKRSASAGTGMPRSFAYGISWACAESPGLGQRDDFDRRIERRDGSDRSRTGADPQR